MKALIVEDKKNIRKALIHLLSAFDNDVIILGECESVNEAVLVANACNPELIFLDINLLDGTGFDFLEQTNNLNFKVIFITAYEEYALQALKIGAVDYLLKPVDVDELKSALKKVKKISLDKQKQNINTAKNIYTNNNNNNNILILSLQDAYQVIDLKELMYCKSDKGYTTFYLNNGKKYLASKPLKEFEEKLNSSTFTKPHQSYLVNLTYIEKYEKSGTICLKSGHKIPVSTRKKENFLTRFFSWNNK